MTLAGAAGGGGGAANGVLAGELRQPLQRVSFPLVLPARTPTR